MNLWIILSLIWSISLGIAGATQKFLAEKYENHLALVIEYIGVVFFATLWLLIITHIDWTSIRPVRNIQNLLILLWVWIFGFIGILFLRKGFEKMSSWIVLVIANLAIFLMYFVNLYLFDGWENLPVIQIILAILFFIVIAQFLIDKPIHKKNLNIKKLNIKKIKINTAAIYPIVTAICRAIFFIGNTYFVKNKILRPVQSEFFSEWTILIIAIIVFLWKYKGKITIFKKVNPRHLPIFALWTATIVTGNFLLYYGYLDTPANIVNVIRLFSIIVTALLARIFLKDKLSKRNMILMGIAFVILILFVFAEEIIKLL